MSLFFSILGDSNVKRHLNPTNCRDRPLMSTCQLIPCNKLSILAESLKSIRSESNVCILSCLTNFLTSSKSAGSSVGLRVGQVFEDVLAAVHAASDAVPDRRFFISPPMYRENPLWYRDGLPEVLSKFDEVMSRRKPTVKLMLSFPNPLFESDGVHLTQYSGLEFVLHLFEESKNLLASEKSVSVENKRTTEVARALQDRVVVLEQGFKSFRASYETKYAEDAELSDFHENLRLEIFFVISGLHRVPDMGPKEWQDRARRDVQGVLAILLGREGNIVFVQNNTSRRKDAPVSYFVQMATVEESREVRSKFGSYFIGGADRRPAALKEVSIRNRVTLETQVRISILRLFGSRYLASNPGSKVQVITYEPRPVLKLTPPEGASDRRVKVFNFIQAVRSLPATFTSSEITDLFKKISPKLTGKLRSLFVVISDDMRKPGPASVPQSPGSVVRSSKRGHSSPSSDSGAGKQAKTS